MPRSLVRACISRVTASPWAPIRLAGPSRQQRYPGRNRRLWPPPPASPGRRKASGASRGAPRLGVRRSLSLARRRLCDSEGLAIGGHGGHDIGLAPEPGNRRSNGASGLHRIAPTICEIPHTKGHTFESRRVRQRLPSTSHTDRAAAGSAPATAAAGRGRGRRRVRTARSSPAGDSGQAPRTAPRAWRPTLPWRRGRRCG